MKLRDKFFTGMVIIVTVMTIIGLARANNLFNNSLFNILISISANIVGWFIFFQIIFWIYDFIKRKSNK